VIAEAIDTVWTLGWALFGWFVLCAVFALCTLAVTVAFACRVTVRAAMGARAWLSWRLPAELPPQAPREVQAPPEASQRRTARTAPSWAQPDEEAA
jgi:hypothetical protein